MMIQKIAAVITVAGAFVLGLHEGDCTAAVAMGLLLLPVFEKRRDKRCATKNAKTVESLRDWQSFAPNVRQRKSPMPRERQGA